MKTKKTMTDPCESRLRTTESQTGVSTSSCATPTSSSTTLASTGSRQPTPRSMTLSKVSGCSGTGGWILPLMVVLAAVSQGCTGRRVALPNGEWHWLVETALIGPVVDPSGGASAFLTQMACAITPWLDQRVRTSQDGLNCGWRGHRRAPP